MRLEETWLDAGEASNGVSVARDPDLGDDA